MSRFKEYMNIINEMIDGTDGEKKDIIEEKTITQAKTFESIVNHKKLIKGIEDFLEERGISTNRKIPFYIYKSEDIKLIFTSLQVVESEDGEETYYRIAFASVIKNNQETLFLKDDTDESMETVVNELISETNEEIKSILENAWQKNEWDLVSV